MTTTMSASRSSAASATRSVARGWDPVMMASPPNDSVSSRISSSGVATYVPSTASLIRVRRYTCSIMEKPWMSQSGFPGYRVDPIRAGMIAATSMVGVRRSDE
jgi:hypothetical protein